MDYFTEYGTTIDHAINGDSECIKLTYQLIDKMEKGAF